MGCVASSKAVSPGPSAGLWWQPWHGQSMKRWWPRWAWSPDPGALGKDGICCPAWFLPRAASSLTWTEVKSCGESQADVSPCYPVHVANRWPDSSFQNLPEEEPQTDSTRGSLEKGLHTLQTWKHFQGESSVGVSSSATHLPIPWCLFGSVFCKELQSQRSCGHLPWLRNSQGAGSAERGVPVTRLEMMLGWERKGVMMT